MTIRYKKETNSGNKHPMRQSSHDERSATNKEYIEEEEERCITGCGSRLGRSSEASELWHVVAAAGQARDHEQEVGESFSVGGVAAAALHAFLVAAAIQVE
jgi:hypothetical protein